MDAGFTIFNRYRQRIVERLEKTIASLDKTVPSFDFSKDENILLDRSEQPWPKNQQEADEIWRKQLKNRVLGLKLAGKEDKDIVDRQALLDQVAGEELERLFMGELA